MTILFRERLDWGNVLKQLILITFICKSPLNKKFCYLDFILTFKNLLLR